MDFKYKWLIPVKLTILRIKFSIIDMEKPFSKFNFTNTLIFGVRTLFKIDSLAKLSIGKVIKKIMTSFLSMYYFQLSNIYSTVIKSGIT